MAIEEVPVAVECRSDRGMSKALLYLLGVPSLARQDGGASVAKVVEAQALRHPGRARRGVEVAAHEIVVTDWTALGRAEDVALARWVAPDVLADHLGQEHRQCDRATVAGLGRTYGQLTPDLRECLDDVQAALKYWLPRVTNRKIGPFLFPKKISAEGVPL